MVFNSINNPSQNNLTTSDSLQQTKLKVSSLATTANTTTLTSVTCSSTKMLLNKMNNDLCNSLGVNMSQRSTTSGNKLQQINVGSMGHSLSIGSISSSTKSTSSSVSSTSSSSGSSSSKKQLSSEDKKINLNALKNQDPFAINIIDTAFRVAVYKFMSKKNEWKKLDVEGSLFLFERMVEPLHSFVVMNTLALHLFLQPITADLEFQDRNPFLLYKSNDDIFGIWFIDKEDCDRVKSTIMDLTESARERKLKRENSKQLISQPLPSHDDQSEVTSCSPGKGLIQIPLLITPDQRSPSNAYEKLISNTLTSPSKPNCDIMQMLAKAQFKFNQSESSQMTITNANMNPSPTKLFSDLFSKPVIDNSQRQFPISLNTSLCLSSSPSTSSTSTGYSTNSHANSESVKEIDPMIQKLLVPQQQQVPAPALMAQAASASTKTLDEIESGFMSSGHAPTVHDLLSEELKRKLNIKSSKVPLASSSMITTPSNPLILSDLTALDTAIAASSHQAKRPITLKDFEENLLNESVSSMNSTNINIDSNSDRKHASLPKIDIDAAQKAAMFYVGSGSERVSSNSNYIRPSQLSFVNKKAEKKAEKKTKKSFSSKYSSNSSSSAASTLSSRSSRSSTSDSSSDTSSASSTSSSPRTLPLLLTPAAFETSSIASSAESTSSSSRANIFNDFLNSQLLSSIDHQQKMAQKLKSKAGQALPKTSTVASSIATSSFSNLLLANVDSIGQNQFRTATNSASTTSINNKNNDLPKISKQMQQATVLNKPQLQQCLIHLLTSDDKFLSSLHQAYLATNLAQQASQNSLTNGPQPQHNSE